MVLQNGCGKSESVTPQIENGDSVRNFVPKRIIVHCSASPDGKNISVDEIKQWHLEKGFNDIGYHYVITTDGKVHEGRSLLLEGAHCEGANFDSIGICIVGNTRFYASQLASLRTLVLGLCWQNKIPQWEVHGHYLFPSAIKQGKTCPNIPIQKILYFLTTADMDCFDRELLK